MSGMLHVLSLRCVTRFRLKSIKDCDFKFPGSTLFIVLFRVTSNIDGVRTFFSGR
jgi:hypothetical protein